MLQAPQDYSTESGSVVTITNITIFPLCFYMKSHILYIFSWNFSLKQGGKRPARLPPTRLTLALEKSGAIYFIFSPAGTPSLE